MSDALGQGSFNHLHDDCCKARAYSYNVPGDCNCGLDALIQLARAEGRLEGAEWMRERAACRLEVLGLDGSFSIRTLPTTTPEATDGE